MQDSDHKSFGQFWWQAASSELLRLFFIELATIILSLIGYGLSEYGHRPEWMPAFTLVASLISAIAIGIALHVLAAFFFAWIDFIENRIDSFRSALTVIAEQLRLPTGLSNDALATLSKYLLDADKLYSVVYVRPSLWLRLGDLMNVFSLQAHYYHHRLSIKRPSAMVRFLIWDRGQFLSPAGIFIIRASILVGAQTRIITRDKLNEVIRKVGNPTLQSLVDRNLHVWLECQVDDNGEEVPHSGSYGELDENGFKEPHSMPKGTAQIESEGNFFHLIKLLKQYSMELDISAIPDHIREANLTDRINHALTAMHHRRIPAD